MAHIDNGIVDPVIPAGAVSLCRKSLIPAGNASRKIHHPRQTQRSRKSQFPEFHYCLLRIPAGFPAEKILLNHSSLKLPGV